MSNLRSLSAVGALAVLAGSSLALAGPLTAGNLLVVNVGGIGALGAAANATQWKEYNTGGVLQQTIDLSSGASGSRLTLSGTATSEGYTGGVGNGNYFALAGYDTTPVGGTTPNVNTITTRTAAVLNWTTGTVAFNAFTGTSGATARSATTTDGAAANIWTGNSTGLGNIAPPGINAINTRNVNIFNGNLYYSTASGTTRGVFAYTGLPTSATAATSFINVENIPTPGATVSPYDFMINSAGTVAYITDDRSAATGGGVQRFNLISGVWTYQYTMSLLTGTLGTVGFRSIAQGIDGTLYVTDATSSNNAIWSVVDSGAGSVFTKITSAGAGNVFRGIEYVPTPGSAALIGMGGLLAVRRRRA